MTRTNDIGALLRELMEVAADRFASRDLAVGVVTPDDVAIETIGLPGDAICNVWQLSKVFTASAVLSLARNGRVTVDAPMATRDAPISSLLDHSSGLALARTDEGVQVTSFLPPGAYYSYSNEVFSLVAAEVEAQVGEPWTQALSEMLAREWGLSSAAYRPVSGAGGDLDVGPAMGLAISFADLTEFARRSLAASGSADHHPRRGLDAGIPAGPCWLKRWVWYEGSDYGPMVLQHGGGRNGEQALIALSPELAMGIVVYARGANAGLAKLAIPQRALAGTWEHNERPRRDLAPEVLGRYWDGLRCLDVEPGTNGLVARITEAAGSDDAEETRVELCSCGPDTVIEPDSAARMFGPRYGHEFVRDEAGAVVAFRYDGKMAVRIPLR